MSRKDGVILASRTLALLLVVWALTDASYLPEHLLSFLHYLDRDPVSSVAAQYGRHYYLIRLGFCVTRIVGFSLMAKWLFKGGPEVENLFFDTVPLENPIQN